MARKDDIVLAKGSKSVTMWTVADAENFKNVLQVIPGIVSPDNQNTGVKKPSVVDLLRITHTYQFECYIYHTAALPAKTVKNNLIAIFNGASVNSTPATLTYEDESIDVFVEDLVIKGISNDDAVANGYTGDDSAEYQVTLTLVEGKLVGQ
jgi:hypothetical protein